MASTSVVFDIIAHDRASDKFDKLGRSAGGTQSRMSKFGGAMAKVGRAGGAVGVGLGVLAGAAIKLGTAAAEDAAQQEILRGALERNADASDEQVAATERWIEAQGKALGVADDELRPALGRLVTATKDVGGAQKLASLAMDVSAGSGKSLESVSTALMKAHNGNVGALARLGINTKNAAGETITMEQATKRMSDQFGGAAQDKAKTLEGKMQRLKVQLAETGEKIGAKLLPFATKLADWMLKDGIPLAKRTGDKFQEWWPKIKKVANVLGDIIGVGARVVGWVIRNLWPMVRDTGEKMIEGGKLVYKWGQAFVDIVKDVARFAAGVREKVGNAIGFVKTIPGKVKSAVGNLGSLLLDAGKAIIQGLIDGITSKASDLMNTLKGITSKIPDWKGPREKDKNLLKPAGVAIMEGLIAGIEKGKVKLTTVLDKITGFIQKKQDRLKELLEKRSAVVESFRGFTSSIFGTDLSVEEGQAPATIGRLLSAGAEKRAAAEGLQADVSSLLSKGLSRDLLEQLQGAGESGLQQIKLLAGGTQTQIDQANADNAATVKALEAAGLAVGNEFYQAQIQEEKRDLRIATAIEKALDKWADKQDKNTTFVVKLDGKDLQVSLLKRKRAIGAPLGIA